MRPGTGAKHGRPKPPLAVDAVIRRKIRCCFSVRSRAVGAVRNGFVPWGLARRTVSALGEVEGFLLRDVRAVLIAVVPPDEGPGAGQIVFQRD